MARVIAATAGCVEAMKSRRRARAPIALLACAGLGVATGRAAGQPGCVTVQVEHRGMYACITGQGPQTIVLAAGAALTSRTWDAIVPDLAEIGRVVTFDRAGLGNSDVAPVPRTPTRIAMELAGLLNALDVTGPLVLVGHSMGGIHVLRYAELFPNRVAAVVLLDAPPPQFERDRLSLLSAAEQSERRRLLERGLEGTPETVRHEREGAALEAESDYSAFPRECPLWVVSADNQDFGNLGSQEAHRRLWLERSRKWLRLSDRSQWIVAEGSGHMIHHDHPGLVVDLIRRAVPTRSRGPARRDSSRRAGSTT